MKTIKLAIALIILMSSPRGFTEALDKQDSFQGNWDVRSERTGGQPMDPRYHRVWSIGNDIVIINGVRTLYYKKEVSKEKPLRFRIFNKVGNSTIILYSCLYELSPDGLTMKIAFNAGDTFPEEFSEKPDSINFVLELVKRKQTP